MQRRVSGQEHEVSAGAATPRVWVLGHCSNLKGTNNSCGIGECGAGTDLMKGEAERYCQLTQEDAAGMIATIEGRLPRDGQTIAAGVS